MSQPIQRQADQWSLPDRQASSSYEPSQAELRDLLSGPKIQSGLLKKAATPEEQKQWEAWVWGAPDASEESIGAERDRYLREHKPHLLPRESRIKEAVPRENPAGDLNMSPRKLDQQVTQQVQNKALKPPKPKPIPDDLGQDQSFKVPNQLKAHRDPQLPSRGYLAAFVRQAEENPSTLADQFKDKKGQPVKAPSSTNPPEYDTGGAAQGVGNAGMMSGLAPGSIGTVPDKRPTYNVQDMPGKTLADQRSMLENAGWGPATPEKADAAKGNATQAPASDLSSISAPAPKGGDQGNTVTQTVSDTKPSSGGGGNASGTGGSGTGSGGGWSERSIAPGSIDTSKTYTVQQGDTLSNIAQGAGLSGYDQLAKDNGIADPNKINVGQEIKFSPSPGGPSTSVSDTPDVSGAAGADFVRGNAPDMPEAGPGGIPLGATSPTPIPEAGGGTGVPAPPPTEIKASRFIDPPLPPKGQLKKFLGGSRRLADTTEDERKRNSGGAQPPPPSSVTPENTNPGLNNPKAPASGGGQQNTPWFTPPAPSSSDAASSPTPSQKAGEPIKPPPTTPAPSQPTSPNTPASSDATQGAPVKTNDLANASNPTSPKPSEPAGNPAQPASPSGTDQPKTPGSYGPDIGNGFSLSDAMGVIGGIGQGINTALSIGGTLAGALSGGGLGSLISGFGGLGMLGSTLGITAAAQQQIEASKRAVKEQYV